jgi:GNAT superfamily N-acetyltransferase
MNEVDKITRGRLRAKIYVQEIKPTSVCVFCPSEVSQNLFQHFVARQISSEPPKRAMFARYPEDELMVVASSETVNAAINEFIRGLPEVCFEQGAFTPPISASLQSRITFAPVTATDFEELATLRIAAMRESLERVGRFNPERARERLRNSFYPEHTEVIVLDGQRIGFYTFRPTDDGFHLDHLYIHPTCQSRRVGAFVLKRLLAQANARQLPIRLGALRNSPSNRFYQLHGFVQAAEDEWDIYYLRTPKSAQIS